MEDKIKELEDQLKVEILVSEKITHFIRKKKGVIEKKAEERDRLKDGKVNELQEEKEKISVAKEKAIVEIGVLTQKCEEEEEDRKARELKDQESAEFEQQKIQEKLDMEAAAAYVQRKWNWF